MSAHVAHHFDDATQQAHSATLGMWLFLATEVLFFGGMFLGYAQYRYLYPHAFAEGSHHLDVVLGTINTGILLASSLSVAMAIHGAQLGHRKTLIRLLVVTIVLGIAFLGIKAYEYWHKYQEHLVPGRRFDPHVPAGEAAPPPEMELFFSFYFTMTAVHALHMVIGIGVMIALVVMASRHRFSAEYYTPVEMSGLYWHFVDIVWVFLFPLLYLVG
ncbi:MAG: cytochrome c oxidase subunit 3 family protein [Pirellulales bacterium]